MVALRRRRPEIASLRRRWGAGAVDFALLLAIWGPWIGRAHWRAGDSAFELETRDRATRPAMKALAVIGWPLQLGGLLYRSPGQRLMGVRHADLAGRPLTVRRAASQCLLSWLVGRVIARLMRPLRRRNEQSMGSLTARDRAIREEHRADPRRMNEQLMELYSDNGLRPYGCWLVTLPGLPPYLPWWWRTRQSLIDRLSGTIVIRTR